MLYGYVALPFVVLLTFVFPSPNMKISPLYPRNREPSLDPDLFAHPSAEYRGTPFWSWNTKLNEEQLLRQIDTFAEMGLGGFHIHVRTGLDTEYLGPEFLRVVKSCVAKAQDKGLLAWLYDEDRWPSGYAGGLVTADPALRARHLLFTCRSYEEDPGGTAVAASFVQANRTGNGRLLGRYEVTLENGFLADYRRLRDGESAREGRTLWYAYLETALPTTWFNHQAYVDTLNRKATERFIETTHRLYESAVGDHFGKTIPAIFTDEPQFTHKTCLATPYDRSDIFVPFTADLPETYQAAYGQRLEEVLPELFWELPDGRVSVARYRYHDHVCERFTEAFADVLGRWCRGRGIFLTGHMMEEPTLQSQTAALGEAMRSYRAFDLPGIDMLCDRREYSTAKQAQSAAHQYGCSGVLSELYGVTGWHFDFTGHKGQGDWQAALGVTVRVHHLTWVSMAGEAKRDYPASIGYQSPWYQEYRVVEDHFARLNTALTRGQPHVRVAVIHPIESYWLHFGPMTQTARKREELEEDFDHMVKWLLFGLIDFDFVCESLLPSQEKAGAADRLNVGAMSYEAVLVPSLETIRSTTLDRLEQLVDAGGTVYFFGNPPGLVDAIPSPRARQLADRSPCLKMSRSSVLQSLEPFREVEVRLASGQPASTVLHQIRQDGECRRVFLCNTDRLHALAGSEIRLRGSWGVKQLDTLSGDISNLPSNSSDGWTVFKWDFPACGSLLLTLSPRRSVADATGVKGKAAEVLLLPDPVPISLSEPNVLLLDQAEWRIHDGAWQPREEILRIDNFVRRHLGLGDRTGEVAQPWTDHAPAATLATVDLRFRFQSVTRISAPLLAVEQSLSPKILVNGSLIEWSEKAAYWVDEAIRTIGLPDLEPGTHEIMISVSFNRRSELEWLYLLGDFGVELAGRHTRLVAAPRTLAFGDWTSQGFPFYAGNLTYHTSFKAKGQRMRLVAPKFSGALLTVNLDGKRVGPVAFPPFELDLGNVAHGSHNLDITVFGNRANAFGPIHCSNAQLEWLGPNSYRTEGNEWAYEYMIRPMGLLVAPSLQTIVGDSCKPACHP